MKYYFSRIFIFFCLFKDSLLYLIFPFKTYETKLNDTDKNITLLFLSLIDNHIFINLEIGEPKQNIEVFLRSDSNDFYISEKPINNSNQKAIYPFIVNIDLNSNYYFDQNISSSLEISNISIISYPNGIHLGNVSNDFIYLKNNENNIIKKRLPFILYHSIMRNLPAVIGLDLIIEEVDKEYNFIDKLKLNDIIDSYFWMINYTSDYEGNFIIGEQPHIFDPINFKEENLYTTNPFLEDSTYSWGLLFDKINFNEKDLIQYHDIFFFYNLNYIKGNIEIEKELDIYFNESIQNGICFKENFKYTSGPYKFFYCDKKKYNEKMKYFPKIEFYQFDFNYTFELNYKDLFIEKHDKLILLIFFDDAIFDWYLGKPFLKKYSFLMNQDSKTVGFYKKNIKSNEKKKDYIILKIFAIIFGIVILLILGVFIGKYYFSDKFKKHKNMLEEEYDYTSKNDEIN